MACFYVTNAMRAKISKDLNPDDQVYKDVVSLCDACLIAALVNPDDVHPSEVTNLLTGCKTEYGCWIEWAEEAIENADLSMLKHAEVYRARLRSAYRMASAWLFHLYELRQAGVHVGQPD